MADERDNMLLGGPAAAEPKEETAEVSGAPPGERETWQWLSRLADDAIRGRNDACGDETVAGNDFDEEGEDDKAIYWGQQWPSSLPNFKLPIVVNTLKTDILSETSDLTDNPLKIFVHKDPTKGKRDTNVETAMQAEWARTFADIQVMIASRDSLLHPAGFLYCGIKENRQTRQKELDIRAFDPMCVFPDPDCTSDEDWAYVLIREVVDLVTIRNDFPERGFRVKPDDAVSTKTANAAPWWQVWKRWGSGSYKGPLNSPGTATRVTGYLKARCEKLTLYIYDDATEEVPEVKKDDQGNPVLDAAGQQILQIKTMLKYPNGRMIVGANGVILYDDAYPFKGPFPIIPVWSEPTTHEFWVRTPAVRGVKELARAGNKMDSMVVENGIRLNNGMVVADQTTGIKPTTWANIPGQVFVKGPGEFKIYYPPPMPDSMIKMGSFFRDLMKQVLGRDRQPMAGNVSGELVETEISEAQGLTRLRARLLHVAVQKLVTQMFYRMAQYYTMPRMIPYGTASDWTPAPWEPINKPEDYGVHVDPASFTLRSKTLLQRLTLALSKMGKVSTEYTLKTLEMPDAKNEAAKADQELALAAEAKKNARKDATW